MPFDSENLYYKSKLYVEKAFELEKKRYILWTMDCHVTRIISSCRNFQNQPYLAP